MKVPALVRGHFFTNPLNSEDVFGGSVTNILRLACSTDGEVNSPEEVQNRPSTPTVSNVARKYWIANLESWDGINGYADPQVAIWRWQPLPFPQLLPRSAPDKRLEASFATLQGVNFAPWCHVSL